MRKKGGNIDQLPPACVPTRDKVCSPGICLEWELNWQPLALWDGAQPTEPRWPGPPTSPFITGVYI